MTNANAIKWLENLKKDIGNPAYQSLWYYEQALTEIIDLLIDRKTENCLEILNNYEPQTCENRGCKNYDTINDHCMFIEQCHYEPKDEPQTKLCRECDDYAGDGMYCASNHIVYNFSTSKENCELQTKQQTKRPWGMYIIEHPMYE